LNANSGRTSQGNWAGGVVEADGGLSGPGAAGCRDLAAAASPLLKRELNADEKPVLYPSGGSKRGQNAFHLSTEA
jgi:hypothetical protein